MTRVLLVTLAALGAVLLVTGLWLTFRYVPGPGGPWPGGPWTVRTARDVHRFTAYAFLIVAVMLVVTLIVPSGASRVRRSAAVVLAIATVGSLLSGPKLAWDQLALWAVTVGTSIRGVFHSSSVKVKFVIADGEELSLSSYNRWAWVHVLVIPLVIVVCGVVLARRARRAEVVEPSVS